jgi:hypothetical protein
MNSQNVHMGSAILTMLRLLHSKCPVKIAILSCNSQAYLSNGPINGSNHAKEVGHKDQFPGRMNAVEGSSGGPSTGRNQIPKYGPCSSKRYILPVHLVPVGVVVPMRIASLGSMKQRGGVSRKIEVLTAFIRVVVIEAVSINV